MPQKLYEVLEVPEDASRAEIQRAYRRKVKENHPDVSDDPDAAERFQLVLAAKEILTDPDERARYDDLGHEPYMDWFGDDDADDGGGASRSSTGARGASQGATADASSTSGASTSTGTSTSATEDSGANESASDTAAGTAASSSGAGRSGDGDRDHDDERPAGSSERGDDSSGRTGRSTSATGDGSSGADAESAGSSADGASGWTPSSPSEEPDDGAGEATTSTSSTSTSSSAGGGASSGSGSADTASESTASSTRSSTAGSTAAVSESAVADEAERTRKQWQAAARDGGTSDGSGPWSSGGSQGDHLAAERVETGIARKIRSREAIELALVMLVAYPIFVFATIWPSFPVPVQLFVGVVTVGLVVYTLTEPAVSLVVFGTWSVLTPLLLLFLGQDLVSVGGLFALTVAWVPFLLALLMNLAMPD